jgi:hypothetical protein
MRSNNIGLPEMEALYYPSSSSGHPGHGGFFIFPKRKDETNGTN